MRNVWAKKHMSGCPSGFIGSGCNRSSYCIGLGSVLGYLIAGLIIGVLLFFKIPLQFFILPNWDVPLCDWLGNATITFVELKIFGLGTLQIIICALALTDYYLVLRGKWHLLVQQGFVDSHSHAVTRRSRWLDASQKIVAILLFEDLLIVPLLLLLWHQIMLSKVHRHVYWNWFASNCRTYCGRLLVTLFRLLAAAKAREVMTAAWLCWVPHCSCKSVVWQWHFLSRCASIWIYI